MTSGNELTPTSSGALATTSTAVAVRRARAPQPRWSRRRGVMSVFASIAAAAFAAAYIAPLGVLAPEAQASELAPLSLYASAVEDAQSYIAASTDVAADLGRSDITYSVYVKPKPKPTPTATATTTGSTASAKRWTPPFVTPNPGSAQAIAYEMVTARGWGDDQFACLVALWKKESGWRVNAYNKSSGAYGIPQSLPGRKMASAGADWETNPATQITWGLGYIKGRYGTPCGAWDHSQRKGWY